MSHFVRIKVLYLRWKPQWLIKACSYWCVKIRPIAMTHPTPFPNILVFSFSLYSLLLIFTSTSFPPSAVQFHQMDGQEPIWWVAATIDCSASCEETGVTRFPNKFNPGNWIHGVAAFREGCCSKILALSTPILTHFVWWIWQQEHVNLVKTSKHP